MTKGQIIRSSAAVVCVAVIVGCTTPPKLNGYYQQGGNIHSADDANGAAKDRRSSKNDGIWTPEATPVRYTPETDPIAEIHTTSLDGEWSDTDTSLPPPPDAGTEIKDRRWQPIYFAYDQSFIGQTERRKIETLADYLTNNREYHLVVEGHCDERGSEEYNRALGEARALAVRDYLQALNVGADRVKTISYGEERPLDPGSTETALALNRRAEFVILLPKD